MARLSRRSFLTASLGVGALGLLAACQAATPTAVPAKPAEPAKPAAAAPAPAKPAEQAAAPAPAKPAEQAVPAAAPAKAASPVSLTFHVNSAIKEEGMTKPGEGRYSTYFERILYEEHMLSYQQKNPNTKITIDWWQDTGPAKILATKAAGQLGDMIHSLRVPFDVMARQELIRPIDDLVRGTNLDLNQWYPNAVSLWRFDVKTGARGSSGLPLMGLPTVSTAGNNILFLNPSMFEKKNVKLPTAEQNLDDLIVTAKAMTERQGNADVASVYGFVSVGLTGGNMVAWVRDFGGELTSADGKKTMINSPEVRRTWQYLYDSIYTHKVNPRPDTLKALGDYKNMFVQQKNPMFRNAPHGSLATSELPEKDKGGFDWDAIPMPKGPTGQRGTILSGSMIGVTPTSKNPDEALRVIAYTLNKDGGAIMCFNAGTCTPRPDVLDDPKIKATKFLQTTMGLIPGAKLDHYTANGRDSEYHATWFKEFDKVLNDQAKIDDAFMANTAKLAQDILDKPPL